MGEYNPAQANYQSFAWNIAPDGLAQSFIQDRTGGEPGGSLAPTLKFQFTGPDTMAFVEQLDYGFVPATTEETHHPKADKPQR